MVAWDERHCELEMDGIGREDDSNSKREHARRIYRAVSLNSKSSGKRWCRALTAVPMRACRDLPSGT
jgi:hypothetical protein